MNSAMDFAWDYLKADDPWYSSVDSLYSQGDEPMPEELEEEPVRVPSREDIKRFTAAEAARVKQEINEIHGIQSPIEGQSDARPIETEPPFPTAGG